MGWRSLPLRRFGASIVMVTLVGSTVGCGSHRVYEGAVDEAESGVAILLEITAAQTADLLLGHTALSEVSEEDITTTFANDMRGHMESSPGPVEKRGVFDIVENPDGTVSFSVVLGSSVFRSGGLITTNQSRHSCGTLTGRFTERALTVDDVDCPPEIEAFAGEDSIAVSMTGNAAKHGVEIGTWP